MANVSEVIRGDSAMPYQHVYGPVPSRRLGRSLGVNPIPYKTCNYSCVYCQLGSTTRMSHERQDWFDRRHRPGSPG